MAAMGTRVLGGRYVLGTCWDGRDGDGVAGNR